MPSADGLELCLIANHYSQQVGVAACEPGEISRYNSANGLSNQVWTIASQSIRPGNSDSFLVAADQCLTNSELLIAKTKIWTQDENGQRWWLANGDPGIIEAHDQPAEGTSDWTVNGDSGATFSGKRSVTLASGLCASWSSEFGASGPLPFTRYALIEAQQRLNGNGCANGGWTLPSDGSAGPIRPATEAPLDSDNHVGGVAPKPASEWCLDVRAAALFCLFRVSSRKLLRRSREAGTSRRGPALCPVVDTLSPC